MCHTSSNSRPTKECKESLTLLLSALWRSSNNCSFITSEHLVAFHGRSRQLPTGNQLPCPLTGNTCSSLSSLGIVAIPQCGSCQLISFYLWFTETSGSKELIILSPITVHAQNTVAIIRIITVILAKSSFYSKLLQIRMGPWSGSLRYPNSEY